MDMKLTLQRTLFCTLCPSAVLGIAVGIVSSDALRFYRHSDDSYLYDCVILRPTIGGLLANPAVAATNDMMGSIFASGSDPCEPLATMSTLLVLGLGIGG